MNDPHSSKGTVNSHTDEAPVLLANSWAWGGLCILLVLLQVGGLLNLSIYWDWMRYGINSLLQVTRFYGGLLYLAAGWFFWTLFTIDHFEKKSAQGFKPGIGDIGPLPFYFLNTLAFWPTVLILALAEDRKEHLKC